MIPRTGTDRIPLCCGADSPASGSAGRGIRAAFPYRRSVAEEAEKGKPLDGHQHGDAQRVEKHSGQRLAKAGDGGQPRNERRREGSECEG